MIPLAPGWRLDRDAYQWLIMRQAPLKEGETRKRDAWTAAAFVGSTKTTLLRVIAELGITLTSKARSDLEAVPERFLAVTP